MGARHPGGWLKALGCSLGLDSVFRDRLKLGLPVSCWRGISFEEFDQFGKIFEAFGTATVRGS